MADFDRCQQESIRFLYERYHAACGDAPGLGKTVTAILAARHVGAKKGLVICPAGVRSNWHEHISKLESIASTVWDVVSYNWIIDEKNRAALLPRYDVCIIDEAHFCKEMESQRTLAVFGREYGLARRARYIWPLSGTFTPNGRPVEYWPMLKTLHPHFAKMSFGTFARKYCGAYFNGREIDVNGASNVEEFRGILSSFIIAHSKGDAFPRRREPLVVRVPVDLTGEERRLIDGAELGMSRRERHLSPVADEFSQLGDAATLRRLAGEAMVPHVTRFVTEKLEGVRKIVVFFQHTSVGLALREELRGFNPTLYRGGMTDAQRDSVVETFATDSRVRVFLGQQQAAGTGINGLQKVCSTVVFAEPDWTPGETEQRVDRLDRKGQEGELVTAYILYGRGTVGAAVVGVHDRKEKVRERLI